VLCQDTSLSWTASNLHLEIQICRLPSRRVCQICRQVSVECIVPTLTGPKRPKRVRKVARNRPTNRRRRQAISTPRRLSWERCNGPLFCQRSAAANRHAIADAVAGRICGRVDDWSDRQRGVRASLHVHECHDWTVHWWQSRNVEGTQNLRWWRGYGDSPVDRAVGWAGSVDDEELPSARECGCLHRKGGKTCGRYVSDSVRRAVGDSTSSVTQCRRILQNCRQTCGVGVLHSVSNVSSRAANFGHIPKMQLPAAHGQTGTLTLLIALRLLACRSELAAIAVASHLHPVHSQHADTLTHQLH
jgi:hypothetical protein